MTDIRLRVTGDLNKLLQKYKDEAQEEISQAVRATAAAVTGKSKKRILRGSKTGIVYQRYNPRRTHQASAPGEAPANDTGRLAGSIDFQQLRPLTWEVGTPVPYGRYLEYGVARNNLEERPWLRPTIQNERKLFRKRLRLALGDRK